MTIVTGRFDGARVERDAKTEPHASAALGRTVAADYARFGRVVKEFGIQAD